MIVVERYDENRELRRSDSGMYLQQTETGIVYEQAVDLVPCKFTYIEVDATEATDTDYQSALTELGVSV